MVIRADPRCFSLFCQKQKEEQSWNQRKKKFNPQTLLWLWEHQTFERRLKIGSKRKHLHRYQPQSHTNKTLTWRWIRALCHMLDLTLFNLNNVGFSCLDSHISSSSTLSTLLNTDWFLYSHHLFLIQVEELQFVRDELWSSGLCSEVQPLPSHRAGPEWKQSSWFRSEASVWFSGESSLQTADSEVSSSVFLCCWDEFDVKVEMKVQI